MDKWFSEMKHSWKVWFELLYLEGTEQVSSNIIYVFRCTNKLEKTWTSSVNNGGGEKKIQILSAWSCKNSSNPNLSTVLYLGVQFVYKINFHFFSKVLNINDTSGQRV